MEDGGLKLGNLELIIIRDSDLCPSPHLLDFEGQVMNSWKQELNYKQRGVELVPWKEVKGALRTPSAQSCRQNQLTAGPWGPHSQKPGSLCTGFGSARPAQTPLFFLLYVHGSLRLWVTCAVFIYIHTCIHTGEESRKEEMAVSFVLAHRFASLRSGRECHLEDACSDSAELSSTNCVHREVGGAVGGLKPNLQC